MHHRPGQPAALSSTVFRSVSFLLVPSTVGLLPPRSSYRGYLPTYLLGLTSPSPRWLPAKRITIVERSYEIIRDRSIDRTYIFLASCKQIFVLNNSHRVNSLPWSSLWKKSSPFSPKTTDYYYKGYLISLTNT